MLLRDLGGYCGNIGLEPLLDPLSEAIERRFGAKKTLETAEFGRIMSEWCTSIDINKLLAKRTDLMMETTKLSKLGAEQSKNKKSDFIFILSQIYKMRKQNLQIMTPSKYSRVKKTVNSYSNLFGR